MFVDLEDDASSGLSEPPGEDDMSSDLSDPPSDMLNEAAIDTDSQSSAPDKNHSADEDTI